MQPPADTHPAAPAGCTQPAGTLAKHGVLVEIWPVKPSQLPNWIRKRMLKAGLNPDPEAVVLLSDFVEGNLLAAQQEIDKLLLLDQGNVVTAQLIRQCVANNARFDSFRLVECSLDVVSGVSHRGKRNGPERLPNTVCW